MNAVDPEIDIAFGREVALAPAPRRASRNSSGDAGVRHEARPDQTVRQQFGQPHRIVDVGLAARHILHMRGVRQHAHHCSRLITMVSRTDLKQDSDSSAIRGRIAQHVGVDVEYINDDLNLSEDLGLDLFDVIELMMVLEEIFTDQTVTNEADEIELVGDLIRHIERHQSRSGGLGLNQLMRPQRSLQEAQSTFGKWGEIRSRRSCS
jgi:acyl carrier protein